MKLTTSVGIWTQITHSILYATNHDAQVIVISLLSLLVICVAHYIVTAPDTFQVIWWQTCIFVHAKKCVKIIIFTTFTFRQCLLFNPSRLFIKRKVFFSQQITQRMRFLLGILLTTVGKFCRLLASDGEVIVSERNSSMPALQTRTTRLLLMNFEGSNSFFLARSFAFLLDVDTYNFLAKLVTCWHSLIYRIPETWYIFKMYFLRFIFFS